MSNKPTTPVYGPITESIPGSGVLLRKDAQKNRMYWHHCNNTSYSKHLTELMCRFRATLDKHQKNLETLQQASDLDNKLKRELNNLKHQIDRAIKHYYTTVEAFVTGDADDAVKHNTIEDDMNAWTTGLAEIDKEIFGDASPTAEPEGSDSDRFQRTIQFLSGKEVT